MNFERVGKMVESGEIRKFSVSVLKDFYYQAVDGGKIQLAKELHLIYQLEGGEKTLYVYW